MSSASSSTSADSSSTITSSASTTASSQVAIIKALTTTFTPPSTCLEMQLTQLASPGYEVWLNEPMPVTNSLYPNCYPTEWVNSYSSVPHSSSSIAPMMSPLVAPEGWATVQELDNGYIALCPSGFGLTPPKTTIDSNRPAYGGTCYSPFSTGTVYTLSYFNNQSFSGTAAVTFKATDNAFAHVIEGHKLTVSTTSTSSGTTLAVATGGSVVTGSSATATAASGSGSSSTSAGVIAGAVVGSVAGLALIILAVFLLFRHKRRQQAQPSSDAPAGSPYPSDGEAGVYAGAPMGGASLGGSTYQATVVAEKDLPSIPPTERATSPSTAYSPLSPQTGGPQLAAMYNNNNQFPAELPDNPSVYEMMSPDGPHPHMREMDGGWQGTELGDNSHNRR